MKDYPLTQKDMAQIRLLLDQKEVDAIHSLIVDLLDRIRAFDRQNPIKCDHCQKTFPPKDVQELRGQAYGKEPEVICWGCLNNLIRERGGTSYLFDQTHWRDLVPVSLEIFDDFAMSYAAIPQPCKTKKDEEDMEDKYMLLDGLLWDIEDNAPLE